MKAKTKNINLTEKEIKALRIMIQNTDAPDNPGDCPFSWTLPEDLIDNGYSRHEAAGYWSTFEKKGIVDFWDICNGKDFYVFNYVQAVELTR